MKYIILLSVIASFGLAGCAHRVTPPAIDSPQHYQQQLKKLVHWTLESKIGVRHANKSDSAAMQWQQDKEHFDIFLSGPLGAGATRLIGTPKQLTIQNGKEETTTAADPELLIEKHLGWTLPLDKLPQWIIGYSDSHTARFNADHTLAGFDESGWSVEYTSYQIANAWLLPQKIVLRHEDMQVTIVIKSWGIP